MKKKSRFLQTPIEPFAVEPEMTADQVLARMERISFQGRNLATAYRIWQRMLQDDVTIFLGMAGALSAGGLRLAVARLRPWNDIRSMRVRRSSADRPGETVNGSTGLRRNRDLRRLMGTALY